MPSDILTFFKLSQNGTESTILKCIRDNSPISRSGVVELTKLPQAAVSRSTKNLLAKSMITEVYHADSTGSRRKKGLYLDSSFGFCLSIEYGPSGIEGVIVDTSYNTLVKMKEGVSLVSLPKQKIIEKIIAFTEKLFAKQPDGISKCLGLAVIDPGIIDEKSEVSVMTTILRDWNNVPVKNIFQNHFHIPTMLLSTSIAKITAIDRLELGNAATNVIYIEYGQGIGCGLKLENNYIVGEYNLSGELGHLRVTDEQIPCHCGSVGCLEAVADLPALVLQAKASIRENSSSIMATMDDIDGLGLLKASAQGDKLAIRIVDTAFEYLGRTVAGLVNILNPKIIVFDSTISLAGKDAESVLFRAIQKHVLPLHQNKLEIRISSLDSYIGVLGGAAAVLDCCLEK